MPKTKYSALPAGKLLLSSTLVLLLSACQHIQIVEHPIPVTADFQPTSSK